MHELQRVTATDISLSTSMSAVNRLKQLLLYTAGTPNGRKVSIHLEELKQLTVLNTSSGFLIWIPPPSH
jgi:hypothetical protein